MSKTFGHDARTKTRWLNGDEPGRKSVDISSKPGNKKKYLRQLNKSDRQRARAALFHEVVSSCDKEDSSKYLDWYSEHRE